MTTSTPPPPPPPQSTTPPSARSQSTKRPSTPPVPNPKISPLRALRNNSLSTSTTAASRPPRPQFVQRDASSQSSQSSGGRERRRSYDLAMQMRGHLSPQQQQTQFHIGNDLYNSIPMQLHQPSLHDSSNVGGSRQRTYSSGYGSGGEFVPPTDANLLMASLDRPSAEDQAEATLLEVLERRHVTFNNQDDSESSSHRRNRTDAQIMLNMDFYDTSGATSTPSTAQGTQPMRRPPLIGRSFTTGRSKRNLLSGSGGNLQSSFTTSPAQLGRSSSIDASDEVIQSFLNPNGNADESRASNQGEKEGSERDAENDGGDAIRDDTLNPPSQLQQKQLSSSPKSDNSAGPPAAAIPRPTLGRGSSYTNRGYNLRHRRVATSLPKVADLGSIGGFADSIPESAKSSMSGMTGYTSLGLSARSTPGERARFVAMTMKAANPDSAVTSSNMEEANSLMQEGALNDLVSMMEANRDAEESSRESMGGNIGESRGGGSRGSAGSRSRKSGKLSANASLSGGSHGGSFSQSNGGSSGFSGSGRRGNRHKPFAGISSPWSRDQGPLSNIDQLFQVAEQVQELFEIPEEDDEDAVVSAGAITSSVRSRISNTDLAAENAFFLNQLAESHPEIIEQLDEDAGGDFEALGIDEQTPMLQMHKAKLRRIHAHDIVRPNWFVSQSMRHGRLHKLVQWFGHLRGQMKIMAMAFDISEMKEALWSYFQNQVSLYIVPALAMSAFFYYRLGNPSFDFLPTDASISWWILFAVRSYLTLTLAFITEYLFVDILATRSPLSVLVIGPLATLYTINAKGWPFVITLWGVWNFVLLHGQAEFNNHWLFFTNIEMFTADNPGGGIVVSDTYKEVLMSMIIAGVATSIKRTILALYLGKRVYTHYKPKLEKLMVDMLLLSEVAELGSALDDFEFEKVDGPNEKDADTPGAPSTKKSTSMSEAIRASTMHELVQRQHAGNKAFDSEDEYSDDNNQDIDEPKGHKSWNRLRTLSNSSDNEVDNDTTHNGDPTKPNSRPETPADTKLLDDDANFGLQQNANFGKTSPDHNDLPPPVITHDTDFVEELPALYDAEAPMPSIHEPVQGVLRQVSTTAQIKSLLERWEEPVNKMDKESDPTIHEILQFRKALSFLDDTHPFSLSFGPAYTRDLCIKSSKNLYKRLLGFSPGSSVLHFDVLGVLAYEADGNFDERKAKGLVRLFRPDKFDELSLLAFVQSCDGVYKKLRYLRASVGNSTLIDYVLENIFNAFFYFFLALTIMAVLELNPWTLLVSLSTIMVSFAFAVGPSAAKLIEGMMMIAIRRPFDLGDRISIVDITAKPDAEDPGFKDTWLVEDVNLFTTTLRLSRTNELSSCNNGSLANTRIINHNRSNNALISISLPMMITVSHEQVQVVRSAIDQYIRDNPRVWNCMVNFRVVQIDPNMDLVMYSVRIQHVKTWQDLLPVLQNKGDLEKFCTEILMQLGIHYNSPPFKREIFVKEFPELQSIPDGAVNFMG